MPSSFLPFSRAVWSKLQGVYDQNKTEQEISGDISFAQARIENVPPESKRETNFLCFDMYPVEQKADLSLSNGYSIQLYPPPCAFSSFAIVKAVGERNLDARKTPRGLTFRHLRTG